VLFGKGFLSFTNKTKSFFLGGAFTIGQAAQQKFCVCGVQNARKGLYRISAVTGAREHGGLGRTGNRLLSADQRISGGGRSHGRAEAKRTTTRGSNERPRKNFRPGQSSCFACLFFSAPGLFLCGRI
jgi:hypothetical protein